MQGDLPIYNNYLVGIASKILENVGFVLEVIMFI